MILLFTYLTAPCLPKESGFKSPQTWWLETTGIHSVPRPEVYNQFGWAKIKMLAGPRSPTGPRKILSLPLPVSGGCSIPCPVANLCLCGHKPTPLLSVLKSPSASFLLGHWQWLLGPLRITQIISSQNPYLNQHL